MINISYADYAWQQAAALLAIDSPSGFTETAALWVKDAFESLGFSAQLTRKGGVLIDLGGADDQDGLMLAAHTDTLGAMVSQIKGSGRLKLTNLGGMRAENAEAENVRVYTREGSVYEGTLQLCNASVHVNPDYKTAKRDFDTTEWCWTRRSVLPKIPVNWVLRWVTSSALTPGPAALPPAT